MKIIILYLFFFFTCAMVFSQKINYGQNTNAGHFYRIRGISLYAETYGAGKPLILLHGNGGSIESMSPLIPYFSKKYKVIAIDSRAQGKSKDISDSFSFEMMADDVAALMDQMKIDSASFIGWSDGGIVALEMAMRHPNKVIKLAATGANIWADSTAFPTTLWNDWEKEYNAQKAKPKNSEAEKNAWKLFLLDWFQPNISLEQLHQIKAPSLIIAGDHDLIRLEHTILIYQNIPNAQLWIVPNSSHGTFIEHHTKAFCETVDTFFLGSN